MYSNQEDVEVYQAIEQMGSRQLGAFLQELSSQSDRGRLRLVLDCSGIRQLNRSTVVFLLSCLEVAMMCNGDVRLAALSPLVEAKLRQIGITRLFELHATAEGAVESFHRRSLSLQGKADQTSAKITAIAA